MRMIILAALCGLATACGPTSPKSVPADTAAPPAAAATEASAPAPNADIDGLTQQVVVVWRSVDDGMEVAYGADGSWVVSYDGDVVSVARWRLFAGNAVPPLIKLRPGLSRSESFDPQSVYLEVGWPQRSVCGRIHRLQ